MLPPSFSAVLKSEIRGRGITFWRESTVQNEMSRMNLRDVVVVGFLYVWIYVCVYVCMYVHFGLS